MESGLEDRNNRSRHDRRVRHSGVSMESGLEDRNNDAEQEGEANSPQQVSMESGLEDRNNAAVIGGYIGPNGAGSQWSPA